MISQNRNITTSKVLYYSSIKRLYTKLVAFPSTTSILACLLSRTFCRVPSRSMKFIQLLLFRNLSQTKGSRIESTDRPMHFEKIFPRVNSRLIRVEVDWTTETSVTRRHREIRFYVTFDVYPVIDIPFTYLAAKCAVLTDFSSMIGK